MFAVQENHKVTHYINFIDSYLNNKIALLRALHCQKQCGIVKSLNLISDVLFQRNLGIGIKKLFLSFLDLVFFSLGYLSLNRKMLIDIETMNKDRH